MYVIISKLKLFFEKLIAQIIGLFKILLFQSVINLSDVFLVDHFW